MKNLTTALLVCLSINLAAQNNDLKRAIKHYHSQNFGLAQREINDALNESFSSDEEVATAMYYFYLIHIQLYNSVNSLQDEVHIVERISEAYTIYTGIEQTKAAEMKEGLYGLSHILVEIAQRQYSEKHYSQYFYTMDHISLILETLGETTGDLIEKLAEDATRLGDKLRATTYWHKLIAKNHKKEFAYKELLSMLYNLKKYNQEVDQLLLEAKSDFPNSHSFAEVEILRYVDKGMKYSALNLAKKVVAQDPTNLDVVFLYGLLSAQHNEHDEALSSFIKVAHMKTDHFETNRELGKYYYRFSNQDGHYELAMKYLEKAHKLEPGDSETKDLLHAIYSETGNDDKVSRLN